ncbi:MAG: hypothetical protein Q8O94_01820, partial [bacterium]|nr:hypothetical protein [bacterium]
QFRSRGLDRVFFRGIEYILSYRVHGSQTKTDQVVSAIQTVSEIATGRRSLHCENAAPRKVLAFSLMPNHFHFVIRDLTSPLAELIHSTAFNR